MPRIETVDATCGQRLADPARPDAAHMPHFVSRF
jgi:hypothetical protein